MLKKIRLTHNMIESTGLGLDLRFQFCETAPLDMHNVGYKSM